MAECTIILDNEEFPYLPGQTVQGKIECNLENGGVIKDIFIDVKGYALVEWSSVEMVHKPKLVGDSGFQPEAIVCSGEEIYLTDRIDVFKEQNISGILRLPPGIQTYSFRYTLPNELPSSYDGIFGAVLYELKVTVVQPQLEDCEVIKRFDVYSPYDLNLSPQSSKTQKSNDIATMYSWCCQAGTIELTASLPKLGFAVGEKFTIKCDVENTSNIHLDKIVVKVLQIMEFKVTTPKEEKKKVTETIYVAEESGIPSNSVGTIEIDILLLDTNLIPNLERCDIINATYKINIIGETPPAHDNLFCTFPVIIGHLALTDSPSDNMNSINTPLINSSKE